MNIVVHIMIGAPNIFTPGPPKVVKETPTTVATTLIVLMVNGDIIII